jgi:protease-4
MRRHPVVLGSGLLLLVGVVFFILAYGLGLLSGPTHFFSLRPKVGIVPIVGMIGDSRDIIQQIEAFADNKLIHAVVLRIDSPGGAVAPSQEIYHAIGELKKRKKVIASMGSIAASGGYLIATAADRIIANPGSITGSISTVMHFANVEELMKKVGIRSAIVKSGKFKDIGSPVREMTQEEKALLQAIVDDIYDQFVETVANNRNLPLEKVIEIADGRIFSGRQAMTLGLIDNLGGLNDAIILAGTLSGIEGKPDTLYPKQKKSSILKYLLESFSIGLSEETLRQAAQFKGAQYIYR